MMPFWTISANASRKRAIWVALAALVALMLVLGCFYRRFLLSGLDLVAEATGGRMSAALCLLLGLLALVWLFVWLLFPLFVYLGMRDLRRRAVELDRTMKLCAQHLARIAAGTPVAEREDTPAQQRGPENESPKH
jgi:hypothetical protein